MTAVTGQPVAHSPDGLDDAVAELLAEVPHVNLDDVGTGVEVVAHTWLRICSRDRTWSG
jgi:hypothetical protein